MSEADKGLSCFTDVVLQTPVEGARPANQSVGDADISGASIQYQQFIAIFSLFWLTVVDVICDLLLYLWNIAFY